MAQSWKASLSLEILLDYHYWYLWFFYILEILCFIYKDYNLPYPSNILGYECTILSFLAILDMARIYFGRRGNLTQQSNILILFLVLSVPTIVGHVFFYTLQTFVLRIEQIINLIALIWECCEFVLAVFTIIALSMA
eukprot:TRINITY_DN7595_c0_g1_i1.p1 TRINITY_DN7595_c0_g1~~TRINITY_DN7595_c0_g1_i1.p1  ORF type:complete len:137 (-),score=8.86 TRINITY_DN7595_c0_g1_i1:365-775(-)